jgi:ABC-type oligopeptide transport system substrate-binding subunit
LLVGLVAGAGVLAAAGLSTPTQQKGGTLRLSSVHDTDSLDPAIAWQPDSWMVEYATCAKLYNYPDESGAAGLQVIPEVATGFPKLSRDRKTQTIELKRTFRFHTGARITAANFVAAFNRDASPEMGSPIVGAGYLNDIVGEQAVIDGNAASISGVRATGPYTLEIRTTRPVPDLVFRLAMPFFCPIATNAPPKEVDNPLGSGPYYIASHVLNRQIVLQRNPFYRGARPANVDRVVWSIGLAPEACRRAVEQNEQDFCFFIPPPDFKGIVAKYGINRPNGRFFFNPTLGAFYFAFNHDRPAFKGEGQIPLKQAINLVVDRHALVAAGGYLSGRRTDQILPSAMGRDADIYPLGGVSERSVARARALVSRAKYKPARLVLYTHVPGFTGVNAIWADIFKYDVRRLGIDVDIKYVGTTFNQLFPKLATRGEPFDVAIGGWFPDYPDGFGFFGPLLDGNNLKPTGNSNFAYFDRPKYNREIERIAGLTGEERDQAWADLDVEMMRDDPPWVPFMNGVERDLVSPSFGCYLYQAAWGGPDLAAACKK